MKMQKSNIAYNSDIHNRHGDNIFADCRSKSDGGGLFGSSGAGSLLYGGRPCYIACQGQRNDFIRNRHRSHNYGNTAVYSGNYGGCLYSYSDYEPAFTGFGQDFITVSSNKPAKSVLGKKGAAMV